MSSRVLTQDSTRPPRVLAVSSGGGHWAELRRMRPAWDGASVTYVVTEASYRNDLGADETGPDGTALGFFRVPDANKSEKLRLLWLAFRMFLVVLRTRPAVVISTGAAPGYFAIRFGKMLGARTVWIDSIANAEEMSVSGKLARGYSDLWLTQWPHLASDDGPHYSGAVI